MSDLLQEAEEELRRETVESRAKKAMPYMIGFAVLALALGGGFQFWRASQAKATEAAAIAYYDAMKLLQTGNIDGGVAALGKVAETAPKGYATLARIQAAAVLQEKGDNAGALKGFDEAAQKSGDKDLGDLARIRAAYIAADSEAIDKLNARLDAIIKNKGSFAVLARELKAAAQWKAGDIKSAKAEYQLLQIDPLAPEGVRARAGQALAVINSGAAASADLMPLGQNPNAQQQQAPQQAGPPQEIGPDGKRIVRLPPGVKLPPGTKIPDDVRIIETPLPAGAKAPQAVQDNPQARNEMLNEIERERQKAMREQEAITRAQQKQVDAITKSQAAPKATNAPEEPKAESTPSANPATKDGGAN